MCVCTHRCSCAEDTSGDESSLLEMKPRTDNDILEKEDKEADKEEKGEGGMWRGSVVSASRDLESFSQCVFEGNDRSKLKWPSQQLMRCVV